MKTKRRYTRPGVKLIPFTTIHYFCDVSNTGTNRKDQDGQDIEFNGPEMSRQSIWDDSESSEGEE